MKAAGAAFVAPRAPLARLSRIRSVSWSGQTWRIRPAHWRGLPGPNHWSSRNVTVRDGVLRLEIKRTRHGWTCAEIYSQRTFGYGRYTFVVNSDLTRLDPWVVLGLFTYAGNRPSPYNEIDIEIAKWGIRRDRNNAQFALQPYRERGNTKRVVLPPRPPYTLWWDWTPGLIAWGATDATGALVSVHSRPTRFVPAGERVHLNLWLSEGHAPARAAALEIASFHHTPL